MKPHRMLTLPLALCLVLSACSRIGVSGPSSLPETPASQVPSSASEPAEQTSSQMSLTDISSIPLQTAELDLEQAQLLDASSLFFTEVLGSRKQYPNSLPAVIGFHYPYVFYERMSVIAQEASPLDDALYIGRYCITTGETQELSIRSFSAIPNEGRWIVDADRVVYMYAKPSLDSKSQLVIELFDYRNGTSEVLSTHSVFYLLGSVRQLNETELVFLLYESNETGTQQLLCSYDLPGGMLRELYRSPAMAGPNDFTVGNIRSLDTGGGTITLLVQQLADQKMTFYLRTLDGQGTVLSETELGALSMYDAAGDIADSLTLKGGYAFVSISRTDPAEQGQNMFFSILHRTASGYRLLKRDESVLPALSAGATSSDVPCAFFHVSGQDDRLFAVDVSSNESVLLQLKGFSEAEMQGVFVDPSGNLLAAARFAEETRWYLFSAEVALAGW